MIPLANVLFPLPNRNLTSGSGGAASGGDRSSSVFALPRPNLTEAARQTASSGLLANQTATNLFAVHRDLPDIRHPGTATRSGPRQKPAISPARPAGPPTFTAATALPSLHSLPGGLSGNGIGALIQAITAATAQPREAQPSATQAPATGVNPGEPVGATFPITPQPSVHLSNGAVLRYHPPTDPNLEQTSVRSVTA